MVPCSWNCPYVESGNCGQPAFSYGLLWGIVADCFGLPGFPAAFFRGHYARPLCRRSNPNFPGSIRNRLGVGQNPELPKVLVKEYALNHISRLTLSFKVYSLRGIGLYEVRGLWMVPRMTWPKLESSGVGSQIILRRPRPLGGSKK